MQKPASTVHPVHFEDFDGFQFERLVFAYHCRTEEWQPLEWYGCSAYFFNPPEAAHELERLRNEVLAAFQAAYPAFSFPSW